MLTSFTFWLIVLIVYLCVSVGLRHRAFARSEEARLRAIEREYPPRGFDSSAIAPSVRAVRMDHGASSRRHWLPGHYRSDLMAAARRLVTSLAFFRRARHDHELHKHDF